MKQKEESKSQELIKTAKILKSGGVIIFPTDTVYGIGCVFDNEKAIDRIYKIKGTEKIQAFPILVSNVKQVENLAEINKNARGFIDKFWPGALTIIMRRKNSKEKVGFRMPDSPVVKSLIEKVAKPIVGTSANFHGAPTPKSYEDLDSEFIKLADFVLKGECKLGAESTVVDTTAESIKVIRQGAIYLS